MANLTQFYSSSPMRRPYKTSFKPEKSFIHTYHINEVPLPYYNPLQDPYLKGYFSNKKVSKQIEHLGFIYEPTNEYAYQVRRAKNAHKFLKDNSCDIPPLNLIKSRQLTSSYLFSQGVKGNKSGFSSPQLKKRSESQMIKNKMSPNKMQVGHLVHPRPVSQTLRKSQHSGGKFRSKVFESKSISMNKESGKRNPEMMG